MNLIYSYHLQNGLIARKFPKDFPKIIYNDPEEKYFDHDQQSYIAVKTLIYNGKNRKICIAYIVEGENVKIKTIHPEKESAINNRITSGRWRKI